LQRHCTELKTNAPKIYKLTVKKEFGPIIGPGGKNIKGVIQAEWYYSNYLMMNLSIIIIHNYIIHNPYSKIE